MSQLTDAKDDLSLLTKSIFDGLKEFEKKYPELEIESLDLESSMFIGTQRHMVHSVKIYVNLV